eukprot:CAMPEP_0171456346 /NCGR_PEP_ID=MMETSP0945-20130129/2867_1 /TAXON_ID=109269 /ORGANISM="Vaucheria litorea, Strain CCMP2940" /LENGTH=216 /DNA_ID=CAMNT_0011981747 /DNA_START=264 /DNA_END=911 /DNA_ORIENTATION=-
MPLKTIYKRNNLSLDNLKDAGDISEILDYLYLGGSNSVLDLDDLTRRHVTHIINCTRGMDVPINPKYKFHRIRFQIDDEPDTNITAVFDSAFEMIIEAKNSKNSALVHCKKGMSRSATIVMAYCMTYENMKAVDALRHLQMKRPLVSPNPGFMAQLLILEKSIYGINTLDIEKYKMDRFASADALKIGTIVMSTSPNTQSESMFFSEECNEMIGGW